MRGLRPLSPFSPPSERGGLTGEGGRRRKRRGCGAWAPRTRRGVRSWGPSPFLGPVSPPPGAPDWRGRPRTRQAGPPAPRGGERMTPPHLASSCCRWFPPSLRRHRRARPQPASPPPFCAHQRCGNGGGMGRGGRSLSSSPRFLFFFLFSLWFCCCCLWKRRPACSKQPYLCFYLGTNVGCVSARACACVRACFLVLGFLKKWEEEKKKDSSPFPARLPTTPP